MASAAEIEAALAGTFGPVRLSYHFEQRSASFAFEADLPGVMLNATIDLDNNRPVVRTATFTIDPTELPVAFDPVSDHIAVIAHLLVPTYRSGTSTVPPGYDVEEVEIPMGLYTLQAPKRSFFANGRKVWDVEASDLSALLLTSKTAVPYTVASGTNYMTAVSTILTLLGLQKSLPVVADTLPVAFTWAPGTAYMDIVNALLQGINFYPIYATATGVFTTRERIDPSTETATATYSTEVAPRLLTEPFVKSQDITRWANRIACVIDDPRRTASYALRTNNDVNSPISVASLTPTGQQPVVNSDPAISGGRVVDLTTADELVQFELRDRSIHAEPGEVNTFPDPRREAHEFYAITVETEEVATLWRCESWKYQIGGSGSMNHVVGRARAITLSQVVAVSGTILAATAAQIVAGGRTIILTLPSTLSWVAAGAAFDAQRANIIAGLTSLGAEANGWNVRVKAAEVVTAVVRTSATVVTITLTAHAAYAITAAETIVVTVPVTAITASPAVFAEPTFTVIP